MFSVRETTDGSLVLMFKASRSSFGGEGDQDVSDLHTTVHRARPHGPNDRLAYKVNYSLLTKAKDLFAGSVIVNKQRRRPFVWPANSTLTALEFSPNGVTRNERDDYVKLVGYTFISEILCYTIFGHAHDADMPLIQGFSKYTAHFRELSLTVYGTFLHLPNYPMSLVTPHKILPMRKNGQSISDQKGLFAPTMNLNAVQDFLQETHRYLAKAYLQFLKGTPAKAEAEKREAAAEPLFHRWPQDNDEVHDEYGIWSIRKNDVYSSRRFLDGIAKPPGFRDPLGLRRIAQNTPEQLAKFGLKTRFGPANSDKK